MDVVKINYCKVMNKNKLYNSKIISMCVLISFCVSMIGPLPRVAAQEGVALPIVEPMLRVSEVFTPTLIKGVKVYPDNPLRFDFVVDEGDVGTAPRGRPDAKDGIRKESEKLIKYFLASLTVPEEDLWVNLSPNEPDRIIPEAFGQTEMGRDLLAQDYMLKQITASLMYPEDELGAEFWERVHEEAYAKYGTTDIPVDTFNKVWIVPEKAVVYENAETNTAFVVESRLKVMLEEDYVATQHNGDASLVTRDSKKHSDIKRATRHEPLATNLIREIIIPAIEQEINEGAHFAQLRQIYHSLILATWYKRNLKESILGKIYLNQNKIDGVDIADKQAKEKIYQQYLEAFKQGAYDLIKEEYDANTQEIVPRKYFSGGLSWFGMDKAMVVKYENKENRNFLNRSYIWIRSFLRGKKKEEILEDQWPLGLSADEEYPDDQLSEEQLLWKARLKDLWIYKMTVQDEKLPMVISLGDLHGYKTAVDALANILKFMDAQFLAQNAPMKGKKLEIILHGDVFDKGDHAVEVFDKLKELKQIGEQHENISVHFLWGNHDYELMASIYLNDWDIEDKWLESRHGGLKTLKNFNSKGRAIMEAAEFMLENNELFYISAWKSMHVHYDIPESLDAETLQDLKKQNDAIREAMRRKKQVSNEQITSFFQQQSVEGFYNGFTSLENSKEGIDNKFLPFGIFSMIVGHGHHKKLSNIDNRIFGIDFSDTEDIDYLVFRNNGVFLHSVQKNKDTQVLSKEDILRNIDEEIKRIDGRLDFSILTRSITKASSVQTKGGIDFNANALPLDVQGNGIDFDAEAFANTLPCLDEEQDGTCERIDFESLESMPITGFTPIIFQIMPMPAAELQMFLGVADEKTKKDSEKVSFLQ